MLSKKQYQQITEQLSFVIENIQENFNICLEDKEFNEEFQKHIADYLIFLGQRIATVGKEQTNGIH